MQENATNVWKIRGTWFAVWFSLSMVSLFLIWFFGKISPIIGIDYWWFANSIGVIFFLIFAYTIISNGLRTVDESEHGVAQFLGAYAKTWEPGPHLILSIGEKHIITCKIIPKGTVTVDLEMDSSNNKPGGGDVDFRDRSAKVKGSFVFRIKYPDRYAFGSEDSEKAIIQAVTKIINTFLSRLNIMTASILKDQITWERIAQNLYEVDETEGKEKFKDDPNQRPLSFPLKPQVKLILDSWGAEVVSVNIEDIDLTAELTAKREMLANVKLQLGIQNQNNALALKERDEAETRAGTQLEVDTKKGQGMANIVGSLEEKGVPPEKAADVLMTDIKFSGIGPNINAVLIADSNSKASEGAQIATGIRLMQPQAPAAQDEEPAVDTETTPPTQP